MTGHADIPLTVKAVKAGAIEFLATPFPDQDVLDAVLLGLAQDRARREGREALSSVQMKFASLSAREAEVTVIPRHAAWTDARTRQRIDTTGPFLIDVRSRTLQQSYPQIAGGNAQDPRAG